MERTEIHSAKVALDMSLADYLADPCAEASLNSGIARVLLERSPAHAYHQHPRLGGQRNTTPTTAMRRGALIHDLLLGGGPEVVVVDAEDWRRKAARDAKAEAESNGAVPVLGKELAGASDAVVEIKKHLAAADVALRGKSEVTVLWRVQTDAGTAWARARLDHVVVSNRVDVYDLKTTFCATPLVGARQAAKYGYNLQAAAHMQAAEAAWPEYAGRIHYHLIFAEPEPPHGVRLCRLDSAFEEHGRRQWERALTMWAKCMATKVWPGYDREPAVLEMPAWLAAQELYDGK